MRKQFLQKHASVIEKEINNNIRLFGNETQEELNKKENKYLELILGRLGFVYHLANYFMYDVDHHLRVSDRGDVHIMMGFQGSRELRREISSS